MIEAYKTNDWQKMLDFVAVVPPGAARDRALNKVFDRLAREHPDIWPDSIGELASRFGSSDLLIAASKFGRSLAKTKEPSDAFRITLESNEIMIGVKKVFLAKFVEEWAKHDPSSAAVEVLGIPDERLRSIVIEHNLPALAADISSAPSVFKNFANVTDSEDRSNLIRMLGTMRADAKAPVVESELLILNESDRKRILLSYYSTKANQDLNAALIEVGRMRSDKTRDAVVESLLPRIRVSNAASELDWIKAISDEQLRSRLYSEFAKRNSK